MSGQALTAFLTANLDALDPDTRQAVLAAGSPSSGVRVDATPAGPVLFVSGEEGRWIPAHSRRDPAAEAARWLAAELGEGSLPDPVFVVRPGLGYAIDAILARTPTARVVAIEPDPALARALLERRAWTNELREGRLVLLCGPAYPGVDALWKIVGDPDAEPVLLVHPVLARLQPERTHAAISVARRIAFDARANLAARRHFAGRYLLNTIENLPVLARTSDVARLAGAGEGTPAVIVGAGPSLDRTYDALAAVRDRVLLVAADTALRPLLSAGIEPDAAVAVDPGEANARHLLGLPPAPRTVLVCEGCLDPRVLRAWAPRLFTFKVSPHHPWPWLEAHGLARHLLPAWGSVVTSAFELALLLGCAPIVFVGLDLAFTRGQPYCRGVTFEEEWTDACAWGVPLPRQWAGMLARWPVVTLPDVAGGETRSAPHLVAFRDWIVSRAARAAGRRVVNATGAGILAGPAIEQAEVERLPALVGTDLKPRALLASAAGWTSVPARLRAGVERVAAGEAAETAIYETWEAFALGRVSRAEIEEAVARAAAGLRDLGRHAGGDAPAGHSASTAQQPTGGDPVAMGSFQGPVAAAGRHLPSPERAALVRAGLSGEPLPDWALASLLRLSGGMRLFEPGHRAEADALVASLVERVRHPTWRARALGRTVAEAASAPPSALFDWPPEARSQVVRLEELYAAWLAGAGRGPDCRADAVRPAAAMPPSCAARTVPGRVRDVAAAGSRCASSRQAWLALIEMWAAAGSGGAACPEAGTRLLHLVAAARRHLWPPGANATAGAGVVVRAAVEARGRRRRLAALAATSDAMHALVGLLAPGRRPDPETGARALSSRPLLDIQGGEVRVAVRLRLAGGRDAATDPRRHLLTSPVSWVPVRRLSGTTCPPAPLASIDPDGAAIVTPRESRQSVRVTECGTTLLEPWPYPIVGEMQWEAGGPRIAWSQAPVPRILRRDHAAGPVIADEVPFVPISVARLEDGRLVWTSHDGLWWWEPGRGGSRLHAMPSAVFVAREGGTWLVDPIPTEGGRLVRRRERRGWRLSADGTRLEVRDLPEEGQAWGDARAAGRHARAYPDADTIRLATSSGAALRLACPWPRSVVWLGQSLLACTSDGTVLVFEHLGQALGNVPAGG
jgi:hypothetical protein